MELPGTTPHAKARIALAKLVITEQRLEILSALFPEREDLEVQVRIFSLDLDVVKKGLIERLNRMEEPPLSLIAASESAEEIVRKALPIAYLIEPRVPGFGIHVSGSEPT